ncbi:DUF5337 domain-containing protein [Roseitranquillus sediminis]|uniref:DUF5337 domain-containing protein n=1 Tax=Roseitranquillus sediminis TaxID=2809051 RepID=UPI001D0C5B07|nr:DUF5337 domain-containing protein [Roseitranquillus sediminis]MBM9594109.1 DUF5337 domain-containing protein [Roseitranquillus sediminis]
MHVRRGDGDGIDLTQNAERERQMARQGRLVALVIVVTMLAWLGLQWLGGRMGWPARWVFLFDLAALAAFVWSLIVTVGIWRQRRRERM